MMILLPWLSFECYLLLWGRERGTEVIKLSTYINNCLILEALQQGLHLISRDLA
jgi:hypothetical protein